MKSSLLAARLLRTSALGVSLAVTMVSIPSFAQDATDTATADDTASNEIVVTAQGRAQRLADVPVAISAVSAETLQNSGANDIRQLNQVAAIFRGLLLQVVGNVLILELRAQALL